MLVAVYKTKKALKESIGKRFKFQETSLFGAEFKRNSQMEVVGPSAKERKWYANVWVNDAGIITKVL